LVERAQRGPTRRVERGYRGGKINAKSKSSRLGPGKRWERFAENLGPNEISKKGKGGRGNRPNEGETVGLVPRGGEEGDKCSSYFARKSNGKYGVGEEKKSGRGQDGCHKGQTKSYREK